MPRLPTIDTSPTLPGFYVSNEDEIRPGDVSMDGSIAFFPMKNLSKIFIRQWNGNGELERLTYVMENPNAPREVSAQPVAPSPQPQSQQAPAENELVQTLNNLNSGLSNAFGQLGAALQNINQKLDSLAQGPYQDDGGRG